MTWKDKMREVVENTLNYGMDEQRYSFHFHSESKFYAKEDNEIISVTETSDHLPSHWRTHARKFIIQIIDHRITNEMNNADNLENNMYVV